MRDIAAIMKALENNPEALKALLTSVPEEAIIDMAKKHASFYMGFLDRMVEDLPKDETPKGLVMQLFQLSFDEKLDFDFRTACRVLCGTILATVTENSTFDILVTRIRRDMEKHLCETVKEKLAIIKNSRADQER